MKVQWLGQLTEDELFEIKEQVWDASGVACALLDDVRQTDDAQLAQQFAGESESQVAVARTKMSELPEGSAFMLEAQVAVAEAEACAAEARRLADAMGVKRSKKKSNAGLLLLAGAALVAAWTAMS